MPVEILYIHRCTQCTYVHNSCRSSRSCILLYRSQLRSCSPCICSCHLSQKNMIIFYYSYRFIRCMLVCYNNVNEIVCNSSNHILYIQIHTMYLRPQLLSQQPVLHPFLQVPTAQLQPLHLHSPPVTKKNEIIFYYSYGFITCMLVCYTNVHGIVCNSSHHVFIKNCIIF